MSSFKAEYINYVAKRPFTVFDIGAYNGIDSYLFYKNFPCNVYAFEASRVNFELVKQNLSSTPIKFYNMAVSNVDGELPFYDSVGNVQAAGSTLPPTDKLLHEHDGFKGNKSSFSDPYMVKATRLDTFIASNNAIPNILHIDVQGAEYYVIESLGPYRPEVIFLEISETEHYKGAKPLDKLDSLLNHMGYEMKDRLEWDALYVLK